jgi:hypothetical protein
MFLFISFRLTLLISLFLGYFPILSFCAIFSSFFIQFILITLILHFFLSPLFISFLPFRHQRNADNDKGERQNPVDRLANTYRMTRLSCV